MTLQLSLVLAMINGFGQMALVAIFYGMIRRLDIGRRSRTLALGVLFGGGALISMLSTSEVMPGVLVDTRAIMVGLAGAFAGVPAGLIAGAVAAGFRYWLGGGGAYYGIVGIGMATVAGIAWFKLLSRRRRDKLSSLVLLGIAIALHSLLALLSTRLQPGFLYVYLPLIWATCLIATLTLGWMMQRENALILREKSLADFAYTDPLTGLANRRAFDRRLLNEDMRARGARYSIVMADLDHFKQINDRFGHEAGDAVLRTIARTIEDGIREYDLVARYGGEEFIILLPFTDLWEGQRIAERMRAAIASLSFELAGTRHRVTASFGVATSVDGAEPRAQIATADAALYRAKTNGRDRVELAVPPPVYPRDGVPLAAPAPAI